MARLLWALPLLLLLIAVLVTKAGLEQRSVAEGGDVVSAEVLAVDLRERSEITRGSVRLRFTPPGATAPVERDVEMQMILLKELEADLADHPEGMTIPIVAAPDTEQIVLGAHRRGQWVLTLSLAAMALLGAVVSGLLVRGWNRLLATQGDPALRTATA